MPLLGGSQRFAASRRGADRSRSTRRPGVSGRFGIQPCEGGTGGHRCEIDADDDLGADVAAFDETAGVIRAFAERFSGREGRRKPHERYRGEQTND